MAVTLAQMSQDVRRHTLNLTTSNMPWIQDQAMHEPVYERPRQSLPCPTNPNYQPKPLQDQYGYQPYVQASHIAPLRKDSVVELPAAPVIAQDRSSLEDMYPPPLPPRPERRLSLSPDPLPPHSNPQTLTQSQSEAFTSSTPIKPVRIGKDDVWDTETGLALYTISREAAHLPSFISTKPVLTIYKTCTGASMGKIKFHIVTSHDIELSINGQQTTIAHSRGLMHKRWGFHSTSCANKTETWYWKRDKSTRGAMLEDAKKNASVLARLRGDLLTFEKGHLKEANYDEIVISAIAMAEAARRTGKSDDLVDLAQAVGDFTAASTGGSGNDCGSSGAGS